MEKGNPSDKNFKTAYRVSYLLAGYIRKSLTEEEQAELDAWLKEDPRNKKIFEELTDPDLRKSVQLQYESFDTELKLQETKEQLTILHKRRKKVISNWMAAASVLLLLTIGLFWFFIPFRNKQAIVKQEIINDPTDKTPPAATKAVILELETGQQVELKSEAADSLLNNYKNISNGETRLSYQPLAGGSIQFHRLTVPVSMQYELVLPDGTKVWLNAGSSLRYPLEFAGTERKVELSGEGYFQVAKNKEQPFRVYANNMLVEATGTAFVINAYQNEPVWRTTLTEGGVRVSQGKQSLQLKPGFSALSDGNSLSRQAVDTTEALGWVSRQFIFNNTALDEILRQAERWYAVSPDYRTAVNDHFTLSLSRQEPLSRLLALLEKTGQVHFKLEGNKLIVMK